VSTSPEAPTLPDLNAWSGTITALTSIAHGGESLGTVRYLRRERFLLPDGTVEEVPVISGNMIRGTLRRMAADLWWAELGKPRLRLPVMHAIWAGGAMAKSTTDPVTAKRLQEVRAACPVIGLFGAAGGGRVIDGTVQIGKAPPICEETAHVRPGQHTGPSVWDITQIEYFSKVPDNRGEDTRGQGDYSPMRFGVETFLAGTQFTWQASSRWATPAEVSLLADTLQHFTTQGLLGGMTGTGMGSVHIDLTVPELQNLLDWRDTLPTSQDALDILSRLD